MSKMYNPPHPGEFIREVYLRSYDLSSRFVAKKLLVSHTTFSRLLHGKTRLSPEMAVRISKVLGRSPESWLAMQNNHDLWIIQNKVDVHLLEPILSTS